MCINNIYIYIYICVRTIYTTHIWQQKHHLQVKVQPALGLEELRERRIAILLIVIIAIILIVMIAILLIVIKAVLLIVIIASDFHLSSQA